MVKGTGIINIDPPIETWYFFEIDCPICRYVLYNIMLPLQTEGYIRVKNFEITADAGTPEVDWFNRYSEWGQSALTRTIRLVDRHLGDFSIRNFPVRILHLWEKKEDFLTKEDIETSELLKKHVMEAVLEYKRKCFEDFHDKKREPKLLLKRSLRTWQSGSI